MWGSNRYRYLMRFQSRHTRPGVIHPPLLMPVAIPASLVGCER
jgi:hypothetical protein